MLQPGISLLVDPEIAGLVIEHVGRPVGAPELIAELVIGRQSFEASLARQFVDVCPLRVIKEVSVALHLSWFQVVRFIQHGRVRWQRLRLTAQQRHEITGLYIYMMQKK